MQCAAEGQGIRADALSAAEACRLVSTPARPPGRQGVTRTSDPRRRRRRPGRRGGGGSCDDASLSSPGRPRSQPADVGQPNVKVHLDVGGEACRPDVSPPTAAPARAVGVHESWKPGERHQRAPRAPRRAARVHEPGCRVVHAALIVGSCERRRARPGARLRMPGCVRLGDGASTHRECPTQGEWCGRVLASSRCARAPRRIAAAALTAALSGSAVSCRRGAHAQAGSRRRHAPSISALAEACRNVWSVSMRARRLSN